jgi:hypothetical protein
MKNELDRKQPKVFISYSDSDEDRNIAKYLADSCKALGFAAWLDKDEIQSGDDWQKSIEEEIKSCKLVLVLISEEALASSWVNREWSVLCEEKWKRPDLSIIPVVLEDAKTPPFLCEYRAFRANEEKNSYENLKRYLANLDDESMSNKKPKNDEVIRTEQERLTDRVRDLKQSLEEVRNEK